MGFDALLERVPALKKGTKVEREAADLSLPMIAEFMRPAFITRPRRLRPHDEVRPFVVVGTEGVSMELMKSWADEIAERDGIAVVVSIDNDLVFKKLRRAIGKVPFIVLDDDTPLEDSLGLSEYPCFVDPQSGVVFQ